MRIDIYSHILPPKYLAAVETKSTLDAQALSWLQGLVRRHPGVHDPDARFKIMDKHEGVVQVLTLSSPPLEMVAGPKVAAELARVANDEMAELVAKYPDRFVGAVASLPMNDVDAALKEADRAIKELGLNGVETHSDVNGKPLDLPEFLPLYELMTHHDLPIWIHPRKDLSRPDYTTESISKYGLNSLVGWQPETTLAMARLVYSGVMEKFPTLKIVTHHAGATVPLLEKRLTHLLPYDPSDVEGFSHDIDFRVGSKRPWVEFFRMFYGDTATYGSTPALMLAHSFFGTDHLLFGTDFPYGHINHEGLLGETIESVDQMSIPDADRTKIYEDNASKLLRLSL